MSYFGRIAVRAGGVLRPTLAPAGRLASPFARVDQRLSLMAQWHVPQGLGRAEASPAETGFEEGAPTATPPFMNGGGLERVEQRSSGVELPVQRAERQRGGTDQPVQRAERQRGGTDQPVQRAEPVPSLRQEVPALPLSQRFGEASRRPSPTPVAQSVEVPSASGTREAPEPPRTSRPSAPRGTPASGVPLHPHGAPIHPHEPDTAPRPAEPARRLVAPVAPSSAQRLGLEANPVPRIDVPSPSQADTQPAVEQDKRARLPASPRAAALGAEPPKPPDLAGVLQQALGKVERWMRSDAQKERHGDAAVEPARQPSASIAPAIEPRERAPQLADTARAAVAVAPNRARASMLTSPAAAEPVPRLTIGHIDVRVVPPPPSPVVVQQPVAARSGRGQGRAAAAPATRLPAHLTFGLRQR